MAFPAGDGTVQPMNISDGDRRALAVILALLSLAGAARWLERPRPVLDELESLDVAALEAASREAGGSGGRQALGAGERIDPNTAAVAELQRLPGVGPAMAQRIVEERDRAPFATVAELQRVRGIGPALAARMAEHVTLPAVSTTGRASQVPSMATSPSQRTGAVPTADAVDLNSAGAAELQALPGIGPALAARLLARRDSLGGFRDWADVDAIAGIGPALLARLQERARLGVRTP
jgi:competence ComEA-like helix-hairpin-helix protein